MGCFVSHIVLSACAVLVLSMHCVDSIASDTPWSYSGLKGPSHWGQLDPSYSLCGNGSEQSPVDVANTVSAALPGIEFNYNATGNQIENNGHFVKINYKTGSSIVIDDAEYKLVQSHFHTPAEHTINNKAFPMEVQHYHNNKAGDQLVISTLFMAGEQNNALHHSWLKLLSQKHTRHLLYREISPVELLPENRQYYRLQGSLTIPPCTENITWIIMKQPVTASREQIQELHKTIYADNNRPVQPLNKRRIQE